MRDAVDPRHTQTPTRPARRPTSLGKLGPSPGPDPALLGDPEPLLPPSVSPCEMRTSPRRSRRRAPHFTEPETQPALGADHPRPLLDRVSLSLRRPTAWGTVCGHCQLTGPWSHPAKICSEVKCKASCLPNENARAPGSPADPACPWSSGDSEWGAHFMDIWPWGFTKFWGSQSTAFG